MMTKKRILSLFLVMVLLLTTGWSSSLAATTPPPPPPLPAWMDMIQVEKTASEPIPSTGPRTSTVKLMVDVTAPEETPVLDIVLVMDLSLSMTTARRNGLKSAADSFADLMLPAGTANRIAVVAYGTNSQTVQELNGTLATVKAAISTAMAINYPNADGWTNMHAGMKTARAILNEVPDARTSHKIIVFMSDGVPNRYVLDNGNVSPAGDTGYVGAAATAFQKEATDAKNDGMKIFTVGLFQGMTTELSQATANLQAAASSPSMFMTTTLPDDLKDIYDSIGFQLSKLVGTGAEIVDYVPLKFTIDTSTIAVKAMHGTTPITPPAAVYDPDTRLLTWSVGDLIEGEYELTYDITAMAPWYGALFTNKEPDLLPLPNLHATSPGALLNVKLSGDEGSTAIPFNNPYVKIRPYASSDDYWTWQATLLEVDDENGLLENDLLDTINRYHNDAPLEWTFGDMMVDLDYSPYDLSSGDLNLFEDGSFTFMPETGSLDDVTFEYRVKVKATRTLPLVQDGSGNGNGLEEVWLYSDPVEVEIGIKATEQDTVTLHLQKYIGRSGTTPGAGFKFSINQLAQPTGVSALDGVSTFTGFEPLVTDTRGKASIELPNGIYELEELDLDPDKYTNDLPADGFRFMVSNSAIWGWTGGEEGEFGDMLDDNLLIVRNIPKTSPTPNPTPAPTPPPTTNVNLTVEVVGPGSVLPGTGPYGLNSIVVFSVTPSAGASFLGWTGPDGSAVSADDRITMSSDRYVIANFGIPTPAPTPPAVVELPPAEIPEAAPATPTEVVEEVVTEETVPLDAPELPKTSGLPLGLLMGLGVLGTLTGLYTKKRK